MEMLREPQIIELFHVAFLDVLSKRVDPSRYVLKGGANQARDVFDLDLLLRRRPLPPGTLDAATLETAADLALQLPFSAFRDQVLPFLEPDVVELYDDKPSWEQMQTFVAGKLEGAR